MNVAWAGERDKFSRVPCLSSWRSRKNTSGHFGHSHNSSLHFEGLLASCLTWQGFCFSRVDPVLSAKESKVRKIRAPDSWEIKEKVLMKSLEITLLHLEIQTYTFPIEEFLTAVLPKAPRRFPAGTFAHCIS